MLHTHVLTFEQPPEPAPGAPARASYKLPEGMTLQHLLARVERECVEDALRSCGYQRGKAAKRLGLSRTSLFERMKAWGEATRAMRRDRRPCHRGPGSSRYLGPSQPRTKKATVIAQPTAMTKRRTCTAGSRRATVAPR